MTRYVISDLHLDHENIIKYCDRPFDMVEEMNERLIENWNETVDKDARVVFLGDLAFRSDDEELREWLEELNGNIVFVEGNHDLVDDTVDSLASHEYHVFEHGDYEFFCTHYPEKVLPDWDGWVIHGHHHNNHPDEYPFVDFDARRVNVSVELMGYTPLLVDDLVQYVKSMSEGEKLVEIAEE